MILDIYRLNLIIGHENSQYNLFDIVEAAIKGGVTIVQLREKQVEGRVFLERAQALKKQLVPKNIKLIINDRVDIALASNADGVHLGQNDIPFEKARSLMGKEAIIGLSISNIEQVKRANLINSDYLGPDYLGVGPVFQTATKKDADPAIGLDNLKTIIQLSKYPIMAIGGISLENAASIIKTGADGLAVISAITDHHDPEFAARSLRNATG